ncbi:hypothetical protein [Flavobacterium sp. JAS]|uniref:hypothetical protein n=1 Tax=Flavobacterium sp. JAS TaxID=2897329 RepID=UPI001E565D2F|nr:hypothetical protein [Flavobacterium sp. JAS]MCD0468725.1 hypothetical protein [Flavobacterium sp. JAS]
MKKLLLIIATVTSVQFAAIAQDSTFTKQMETNVSKLDNAKAVGDYQVLANDFTRLADSKKTEWLPYYYAAFCNAKISWLYQQNADKIEPFANLAEQQIKKTEAMLDMAKNKIELSEVYCVLSMVNRARVFISPMSNGKKYGPIAKEYIQKALQFNSENPRANYLAAWEKYYTPKLWGGDKDKAKVFLDLAMKQLENKPSTTTFPRWGKSECEAILTSYNK